MERNARAMAKGSPIMRHDLEESLERHAINPLTLSAFQRILLTTDGTVTEILEAFSGESIRVVKLFQEVAQLDRSGRYGRSLQALVANPVTLPGPAGS